MKRVSMKEWKDRMQQTNYEVMAWGLGLDNPNMDINWFQRNQVRIIIYGLWALVFICAWIFGWYSIMFITALIFGLQFLLWGFRKVSSLIKRWRENRKGKVRDIG